jgi:hypothetical protein
LQGCGARSREQGTWALRILQSDQEFQLKELYDNDPETAQHWDRVMEGKKHATFKITTKIFTAAKDYIDGNTENDNLNGLDTNTNRHEGQSNQELAYCFDRVTTEG